MSQTLPLEPVSEKSRSRVNRIAGQLVQLACIIFAIFSLVGIITAKGNMTEIVQGALAFSFAAILYASTAYVIDQPVKARYHLKFLSAQQAVTFRAIAEVIVDGGKLEILTADDLVRNEERYFSEFTSSRKSSVKIALFALEYLPLIYFSLPMSWMSGKQRVQFIKKHFMHSEGMLRDLIRGIYQLCYLMYYGDERTNPITGYVPFEQRKRYEEMPKKPNPPTLPTKTPANDWKLIETDICIIGSGAAGSVLAAELSRITKRRVTVIERGHNYTPHEDFTNKEPEMIGRLYVDGGLQLTQDFDLSILQGSCVGGTTLINNGICFQIPQEVLDEWKDLGAYVDEAKLAVSYNAVEKAIGATPLPINLLNEGSQRFVQGAKELGIETENFSTNFGECGGCGLCNLGCKYNRKLSMLLNYLPQAVENGVEIISDTEVLEIEHSSGLANAVVCQSKEGHKFRVRAQKVIVSAGAIGSSVLLLKSGIKKNVGTRISFNIASPMLAKFKDNVNSYDGVQMCSYIKRDGMLIETTFNPPAATSLLMSGWFRTHFDRMLAYKQLSCVSPVIGSAPTGTIAKSLFGSYDVKYTVDPKDFATLKKGIKISSEILFAAGAQAIYPATFSEAAIESPTEINRIVDDIREPEDISLTSAHPQGGNPMSDNPEIGAVDTSFRVHGFDNLYVCDASIFPTSIRVNPQLTIMAMADYAAQSIARTVH